MKQLLFIGVLAVAMAVFVAEGGNFDHSSIDVPDREVTSPAAVRKVVITMLHPPERSRWLVWAKSRYTHVNPEAEIKLITMGSVESIDAIIKRKEAPLVWAPANRAVLELAASRWLTRTGGHPLYHEAPLSLGRTVLVFVASKVRAKLVRTTAQARPHGDKPLELLLSLAATPNNWQTLGGPAESGPIRFGYPNPLRAALGIDLLYLAALAQAEFPDRLDPESLDALQVSDMFRGMSSGQTELKASPRDLMGDMMRFGAAQYDVIVSYESLALLALHSNPELEIHYPRIALWSDSPAVVLDVEERTPIEKAEAARWIDYLRTPEIQREGIHDGVRPADPDM